MNVKELFKGIAVVIDDEIDQENASIHRILDQLEDEFIPYVKYSSRPNDGIVKNLQNVSFVLLDWKLEGSLEDSDTLLGVSIPAGIRNTNDKENIDFLKKIHAECFCPIFIFTNENTESIILKLKQSQLYKKNSCNNILVKSKSDFEIKGSLFSNLESWLKEVAPIYLLKEWDNAYQSSKSKLFIDFQKRSSNWAKILWKTYTDDNVNPCLELGDFISRSITTQMMPLSLEGSVFENCGSVAESKELVPCLERQCYVQNSFLDRSSPEVGDVFKIDGEFYVNIRPSCDLISRNGSSVEDVCLYLLKPEKIKDNKKISEKYNRN